ncbi:MAG: sulfocyanin-like copper-binding protein, partial [Dehalococcoidia bacterium]
VELVDMDVLPETSTAPAGSVDFVAENTGALPHELIVVRTDLAEEDLPMDGGVVDVSQLDILGETDEFATGEGGTLTVTLEAGDYVLFCNVAGHYASGMHTPFTVE